MRARVLTNFRFGNCFIVHAVIHFRPQPMSDDTRIDETLFQRTREDVDHPLYRLFMKYGHGNRKWFGVGLFASMGARFLSLIPPVLLGAAIDAIFQQEEAFALPGVPQAYLPTEPIDQFTFVVIGMGVALVGTAVLNFVRMSTLNLFSHRVKHEVRTATYQQMQRLDMAFFHEVQTGELMSILSNDTNRLEQFLDDMMGQLLQLSVLIIGTSLVLLWINWQLALVTLLLIPAGMLFTWWFMYVVEERYDEIRASVGDINSRLENNLNGIEVIKASTTEPYEDDRVEEESYEYFQLSWAALRLNFIYRPGLEALTGIAFVITFLVGGLWLIQGPPGPFTGSLTVGDLVIFLLLTQQLVQPLAQIGNAIDRYEDARASTKRILGIMRLPVHIHDSPDATTLETVEGHVEYDDVTFGYDPSLPVLRNIDFSASPGDTIGLVGPTGAGKTTIVKLLLRLYDVDDGAIRIDGTDIRDVTLKSLRQSMGYVGQDNFLFDGTVRENISYGRFGADEAEIIAAAKRAQAHDFISQLPNGYETQIGERGSKLSGGQQQRVAIARTILQDPAIMIFDEATSAVDTETEMLIQRSINELAADRTTFVIAHRLSTVRHADTILVIEDGQIVEEGDHDELISADGLYANLWRIQAGDLESLPDEFIAQAAERVAQQHLD